MRILNVVGVYPSLSETFVVNQIEGATERGCEVWVYAAYGAPAAPIRLDADLAQRVLYTPPLTRNVGKRLLTGSAVLARMMRGDTRRAAQLVNVFRYGWDAASLKLLHRAAPLIGHGDFDVIHCQFGSLAPLVLALRREGILRGAVLVNFRGHDISAMVRRFGPHYYDNVFRDADMFVTNCEHFRTRLERLGCDPERLEIVYSGIDTHAFPYRPPREKPAPLQLVAVGRLVEKKGLRYAIDAAALLRERGFDFQLRIIGDGPLEPALKEQVAGLGLEDQVSFLGGMPHAQVMTTIAGCDVMVSPNVTAADGDEDGPVNTIKEAMAIGMPVVSTRHGGIPELVLHGTTGLLAGERDARGLAAHIAALAASVPLRKALSVAGRSYVRQVFELSDQHERLIAAYGRARKQYEDTALGTAPPPIGQGPAVARA